jgi:ArsR family transcriptional regulator
MKTHFNLNFLEEATETLRAIAHPIRLAIIEMLERRNQMNVTEIFEELEIEQAIASHHLRILKDKNVVYLKRVGKNSYYYLSNSNYKTIIDYLLKTL